MKRFVLGFVRSLLYAGLNRLITCRLICFITKYTRFSHSMSSFTQKPLDIRLGLAESRSSYSPNTTGRDRSLQSGQGL